MIQLDLLRPYQIQAATQLARREKVGLWMAAGTGKTATILGALAQLRHPIPFLVVTRALGRGVWERDAKRFLGSYYVPGTLIHNAARWEGFHGENVYSDLDQLFQAHNGCVVSYDILRGRVEELSQVRWRVVIFDEAHLVKGGHLPIQRKRDGSIHYTRFHFARRLAHECLHRGGYVWQMTATPIKDRPRDLWGQLELVAPGQFGSAWEFLHRYCQAHYGTYGLVTSGLSNEAELSERCSKLFVRVKREEIADQLPELTRTIEEIDKDEGAVEKWGGTIEDALARAAQMKYNAACELAADYLNTRGKVVCVVNRRRLVPQLYQAFERNRRKMLTRSANDLCKTIAVTGDIEASKRAKELDAFNEGSAPSICFATMDSLGESINLHKCDVCLVLSLPYTHGQLDQLEGRFARLGGIASEVKYLIVRETIDERIRELLLDKQEKIVKVQTGTTDVDAAKGAFEMRNRDEELLASLRKSLE